MPAPPDEDLLDACRRGDTERVGVVLETYRERLVRMVSLRLDPRVRRRADPRDVVQESLVEVLQRLPAYADEPAMEFFLWVRFLTLQKVVQFHRTHLGAECRDAGREVGLAPATGPEASSLALASALLDGGTTPSAATVRADETERLRRALDDMNPIDREVLVLRHFEHLTNAEVAELLELTATAASQRYLRALRRIESILERADS